MVTNTWDTGYVLEIRLTNLSTQALNDWQLGWRFAGPGRVLNAWNAQLSGTNPYQAAPVAWNRTLAPNGSTSIGMVVSKLAGAAPEVPLVQGGSCR